MMDLKLAWRAWRTRYRDQVFELRAISAALRSGGVALTGRDKPLLVLECEGPHMPAGKTVQQFIALVVSLGYTATGAMLGRAESPAANFRNELHQKRAGKRFWDAKDCYNNFIFRPTGAAS